MDKIPCIKCTPELWKYIQPYLERWGYKPYITFGNLEAYPLLVINITGNLGLYNNLSSSCVDSYNRELVTDVEEFLERAAELMNFTYKRKDIMEINGIEIKPGMSIFLENESADNLYIVFPVEKTLGVISYGKKLWWEYIDTFVNLYSNKIVRIDSSILGTVLWEKPKEIILTMDEIAEKFGYNVEQIQIKK